MESTVSALELAQARVAAALAALDQAQSAVAEARAELARLAWRDRLPVHPPAPPAP
jgi:outer membrane protein TolC